MGEREAREAVAVSALVRHWSTSLNGAQVDPARFKKDVDTMIVALKRKAADAKKAAAR